MRRSMSPGPDRGRSPPRREHGASRPPLLPTDLHRPARMLSSCLFFDIPLGEVGAPPVFVESDHEEVSIAGRRVQIASGGGDHRHFIGLHERQPFEIPVVGVIADVLPPFDNLGVAVLFTVRGLRVVDRLRGEQRHDVVVVVGGPGLDVGLHPIVEPLAHPRSRPTTNGSSEITSKPNRKNKSSVPWNALASSFASLTGYPSSRRHPVSVKWFTTPSSRRVATPRPLYGGAMTKQTMETTSSSSPVARPGSSARGVALHHPTTLPPE